MRVNLRARTCAAAASVNYILIQAKVPAASTTERARQTGFLFVYSMDKVLALEAGLLEWSENTWRLDPAPSAHLRLKVRCRRCVG